ncbi:NAD(P)H-dependent oxidoreductase [Candidatus Babeliales bacterium]|nr:NAD(P)H-dependent oxidoreductase [Candidatus Babeliales bacterium]
MKVYAIFANDNVQGTTQKLFNQATKTLAALSHEIDILNLYDRKFEIPFFYHDQTFMESHPFYLENKKRFLEADALLLVFPLYWYSVPAIMKAWLDLINAWAYKYESGTHASPLHKIKRAIIIYSSLQNKQHLSQNLHNPVEQQLSETCKFIGIPNISIYMVDQVNSLKPEDLNKHLKKVEQMCKK